MLISVADVSIEADVRSAVRDLRREAWTPSALVNNAAVLER
jgi:NAD(P)-dependent dehydrogenase (short-subunit alcohol dehydrogenase family)